MYCALRGFSKLKSSSGKKIGTQQKEMETFYHGKVPNYPSKIGLLCNTSYSYISLYDEVKTTSAKKTDTIESVIKYKFKDQLSVEKHYIYYSSIDISTLDLEKKNQGSNQLLSGCQILDIAENV